MEMTRIVFAMAVATLLMFAVSGTSQAAPIAPPTGVISSEMSSDNGVTQVRWWHGHRRHCWRGRWGRVHCRWW
jgi:hypothetical protein